MSESGKRTVDRLPDTGLMLRVRDGDECAFAEIYRRYHRKLLDFFYGLSSNAQCAEDLCHETLSRIWQVRRRYAATGSFPAYVFTFARNIWLENCRRLRKQQRLGSRRSLEQTDYELAAAVSSHPDEGAARSELNRYILEALDALPEDQRMAFVMRNIEGMAIADIAAVMQCPENTVRSRKILALKKLRVLLQKVAAL